MFFTAKRKNGWSHYIMVQPFLFFLYFDFTLGTVVKRIELYKELIANVI